MNMGQFYNIHDAENNVGDILEAVLSASITKPTIGQLLQHHRLARGVNPLDVIHLKPSDVDNILKEYLL